MRYITDMITDAHVLDTCRSPLDRSRIDKSSDWSCGDGDRFLSDLGIGHGRIIVSRVRGIVDTAMIRKRLKMIEQAAQQYDLTATGFCLIEDFSRVDTIDLDSRMAYIEGIRQLEGLRGLLFCQASALLRFVIRLGHTFNTVPFPVKIVSRIDEAFRTAVDWIEAPPDNDSIVTWEAEPHIPRDIESMDDFFGILGEVAWDRPGMGPLERVLPTSRWYPVVEAMVLIKQDLDALMIRRQQRLKELQIKNTFEKRLQEKMAGAIAESESRRRDVEVGSRQRDVLDKEVIRTQKALLFTLGEIIESRSRETANHIRRVSEYSALLGTHIGLSNRECTCLLHAAPMHDAGKLSIPDRILNKPGKLTPEEFDIMKTHSERGFDLFRHSTHEILEAAAVIAHEHHEKWNGSGYPRGLQEEAIHVYGRITALADVFDALGSDRCYKKAWDLDRVLALIQEQRGNHFDPAVVDAFFDNIDGFLSIRERFPDVSS